MRSVSILTEPGAQGIVEAGVFFTAFWSFESHLILECWLPIHALYSLTGEYLGDTEHDFCQSSRLVNHISKSDSYNIGFHQRYGQRLTSLLFLRKSPRNSPNLGDFEADFLSIKSGARANSECNCMSPNSFKYR